MGHQDSFLIILEPIRGEILSSDCFAIVGMFTEHTHSGKTAAEGL